MSITPRSARNQKLHDSIIMALQATYLKNKGAENAYINPGDSKGTPLKGHYPDVIVQTKGSPTNIFEVETDETVVETEVLQWKTFHDSFGTYYLVVPEAEEEHAKAILLKNGLLPGIKVIGYKWKDTKLVFTVKLP
jgi:hypothetical protein